MNHQLPGLPHASIAKIDCGSCTKCCVGFQQVVLVETDDPHQYRTRQLAPGIYALEHKPNGDCIYLGENGCTIYGRHPTVCKVFDCSEFVRRLDAGTYEGMGAVLVGGKVIKEGRKRLSRRSGDRTATARDGRSLEPFNKDAERRS